MNKGQEILEAVDERGEIGILDAAAKSADTAAGESLLAMRLGSGETIFIEASRLAATSSGKFRFNGSFQDVPRSAAQISTGGTQANSNQQNSNQQNLGGD